MATAPFSDTPPDVSERYETATSKTEPKFCKNCDCVTERHKDGKCRVCVRKRTAAYYASHKEQAVEYGRGYRADNKEFIKELARKYRAANKEKIAQKKKDDYAANPEKIKQQKSASYYRKHEQNLIKHRAYYHNNKEKLREGKKRWLERNRDHYYASVARWQAAHPERVRAFKKAWEARNPEAKRAYNMNRRARVAAAVGQLSKGLGDRLFKLQRGKCACCGKPLGKSYHFDHIEPLARGGSNTDDNIQLLRASCNKSKGAKHPVDFMQKRGFLL